MRASPPCPHARGAHVAPWRIVPTVAWAIAPVRA
jgi:hypothetical protein